MSATASPKKSVSKAKKRWFILCGIPLVFLFFVNLLPSVYTPPALTNQKLDAYNTVIAFIQTHRQLGDVHIPARGGFEMFRNNHWVDYRGYVSPQEFQRIESLAPQLDKVGCRFAWSEGDMILFQPANSLITPLPAGILFSMRGRDPNIVGGSDVYKLRPFEKITGNWYACRALCRRLSVGLIDQTLKKPNDSRN